MTSFVAEEVMALLWTFLRNVPAMIVATVVVCCAWFLGRHVATKPETVSAPESYGAFQIGASDIIEYPECGVVLRYRESITWVPDVRYDRNKGSLVPLRRRGVGSEGPDQPK